MRKHFEAGLMPSFGYSSQEAMFGLWPAKPCQHSPPGLGGSINFIGLSGQIGSIARGCH